MICKPIFIAKKLIVKPRNTCEMPRLLILTDSFHTGLSYSVIHISRTSALNDRMLTAPHGFLCKNVFSKIFFIY